MAVRRDRMTNTRPGRRGGEPCPTCLGAGALLPTGGGHAVSALQIVPHRRAWRNLPVAPCPVCRSTGLELRRPVRGGQG